MRQLPDIDWTGIETVLLDMDGTLLDLRYDNVFWLEYLPQCFARHHRLTVEEALAELMPRFAQHRGTLQWYCVDYWSTELGLDVAALKPDMAHLIDWHPGAEALLTRLAETGRQRWLATNAHWHSFNVKDRKLGLGEVLDKVISAHDLGHAKESAQFWSELSRQYKLNLAHCALIDDNIEALDCARDSGVGLTIAISKPDSGRPARLVSGHPAVESLAGLIE